MRHLILCLLLLLLSGCTLPSSTAATPSPAETTLSAPSPTIVPTEIPAQTETSSSANPYDPRVTLVTLTSTVLGIEKSFYIYLPPNYDMEEARYPVLYLFRGHEKEWVNPSEDASRQGETVIDVYEELFAAGEVGPMILVFPGMSSDDNSVPGMLVNMESPDGAEPGIGSGRFEDYFLQELIPYIDATYRTTADPSQRGVDGFSLGGFMATKIATQHPDLFGTVGAFDGLYFYTTPECQLDDPQDNTFDMGLFDQTFGTPRDIELATANNAPSLICAADPAAIQSIEWFIQFGPESAEPNDANFYRGEHLLEQLEAKGVTNAFADPILEGGHHWMVADEHMRQTLPLHWQALSD
jgi:enterochelin esterase-like enzyme